MAPRDSALLSSAMLWSAAESGGVKTCKNRKWVFAFVMTQLNRKIQVKRATGLWPVLVGDHRKRKLK